MGTKTTNVTAENTLSATVKYSNKDDAARGFDITANVNIQNGEVNSIEAGDVRKLQQNSAEQMNGSESIASFSAYGEKSFNLNVYNADEQEVKSMLNAVYAFIASVKSSVSSSKTTDA